MITPVRQGAIRPKVSCICSLTVVVYFSLFMSFKVNQRQPLQHDPRLPPGWSRVITVNQDGSYNVSIMDRWRNVFRSRQELQSFVYRSANYRPIIDPNKIDFSIFGENL